MQNENKAMTVGDWIITFILLALPLVGIILQFVWAFSSDTQPSKKTFCQASLILMAFFIVVGVIMMIALGGFAAVLNHQLQPQLQQ